MTIQEFCTREHVRIRLLDGIERVASGRRGHIFEWGDGRLALYAGYATKRKASGGRTRMALAGAELHQEGDFESIWVFDPKNSAVSGRAVREA